MALADRKTGMDVSLFSVGGLNLLGLFTECTLEVFVDLLDSTAVQDFSKYHKTQRTYWRLTGGTVVETHASNLISLIGQEVGLSVTNSKTGQGGTSYAGTGILSYFKHSITESQNCRFEITGNGMLQVGAA